MSVPTTNESSEIPVFVRLLAVAVFLIAPILWGLLMDTVFRLLGRRPMPKTVKAPQGQEAEVEDA
jgi:hypothetical protein